MKFFLAILFTTFSTLAGAQVEWLTWEEAMERQQTEPRKVLVDVYTDWCGWCKQMDKKVFSKKKIAERIGEDFYAVKLNAEQTEDITFDGHVFSYDGSVGRRGIHTLAASLLDGRLSYPSIVYLDENNHRITISPGFKPADKYVHELSYISEEHYREVSYQDYMERQSK